MKRCARCGEEVEMPFTCNFCGLEHCPDHRLPENHDCPHLPSIRSPTAFRREEPPPIRRVWRMGWRRPSKDERRLTIPFSRIELQHIAIAWLVISVAFSVRYLFFSPSSFPLFFTLSLITVGLGFLLHEMAHKFMALRLGLLAEFRLWAWGLLMALIFAFISRGTFIFAAPGAVYITPGLWSFEISRRENGLVSLVGPLTNVLLALLFFLIASFQPPFSFLWLMGRLGFGINLWLAAFNLLPFGGLDGQKVFGWSIPLWAAITLPLWAITLLLRL